MPVPDYQSLMLPLLETTASGQVIVMRDAIRRIADTLNLSEEDRRELLPSGKETLLSNRVYWARTYLSKAGLVAAVARGQIQITEQGKAVLAENPGKIDNRYLDRFTGFRQFRTGGPVSEVSDQIGISAAVPPNDTPDDTLRTAHDKLNATLAQELLDRVIGAPSEFLERLIVSLLVAMGYGVTAQEAGDALRKSGDDGIDGVVDRDALGLERVYVQAKKYALDRSVGSPLVRDFAGSLDMHKATQGVFVTTSTFSGDAVRTAQSMSKRIALINGAKLAELMIRHNVGCHIEETLYLKRIDEDFFE